MQKKIRLMIIDDSIVFRTWLTNNIERDQRFEIVGYGVNAIDARNQIPVLKPDILTLDIEMPGMSGIDFLKEYLPTYRLPVILVSSLNVRVFDALAAGAVDFVRKPDMGSNLRKETFVSMLISKLIAAAQSNVHIPSAAPHPAAAGSILAANALTPAKLAAVRTMIIAIGASTGGTEAILEVLRQFPAGMPGVVITQHMPEGFTAMYAERLNRLCRMDVREAKNGDRVQPGLALLAPGGVQMKIVRMGNGYAVNCTQTNKVNGHCPSVDVLFDSVSNSARDKAIGIILTGMGSDGATGLLRMRKNGAYTIGQNKETCVVYGMPMEAQKIGATCQQAALSLIPKVVFNRLSRL